MQKLTLTCDIYAQVAELTAKLSQLSNEKSRLENRNNILEKVTTVLSLQLFDCLLLQKIVLYLDLSHELAAGCEAEG